MREESNLWSGTSFILERPDDLEQLDPSLGRLITPTLKDLFIRHPVALLALASRATFAPLKRWLEELSRHGCELGIHTPGGIELQFGCPSEVFLQVGPVSGRSGRPYLLSGGIDDVPPRCPMALAEVLRLTGVIWFQYGGSVGLLHPSEQRSVPSLGEEQRRNMRNFVDGVFPDVPQPIGEALSDLANGLRGEKHHTYHDPLKGVKLPDRAEDYYSFYTDGCGGWIATNPSGLTFHSCYQAGPHIDDFLTAFFERPGKWQASFSD